MRLMAKKAIMPERGGINKTRNTKKSCILVQYKVFVLGDIHLKEQPRE